MLRTESMDGEQAIARGAERIRGGDVVAFPTETVYGLGADAFDRDAIRKIYAAKGRPSDNPLIVHVADKSQIDELARTVSLQARTVIDAFMPGPITIILPRAACVPDCVTAGLDTVGIRMPAHPVAQAFLRACGTPVAAPSANRSARISPTSARHVYEDMQGRIGLIIDGGACDVGIESTIVDLSGDTPIILRPGAITPQMLADALGRVETFAGEVVVARAPGMKYKHYAPDCPMVTCADREKAFAAYDRIAAQGGRPILLCGTDWTDAADGRRLICLGDDARAVMRNIYDALHRAQAQADYIVCQDFGDRGAYASVMNRVRKASGGNAL